MMCFFHGLIGSASNWDDIKYELEKRNNVCFVPELDYFNDIKFLIESSSSSITNILKNVVGKKIAVGNSIGCLLALINAEKFDRIILTAPPFKFSSGAIPRKTETMRKYIQNLFCNIPEKYVYMLENTVVKYGCYMSDIENVNKLKMIKNFVSTFDFDYYYEKYKQKIIFIIGDSDVFIPVDEFIKKYSYGTLKVLVSCGHCVPIEKPKEVVEVIGGLL